MTEIKIERTVSLNGTIMPEMLAGTLYGGEKQAHKFIIHATYDGAPVTLEGEVTALLIRRADGGTVPMEGSIQDGAAIVTLDRSCYIQPGAVDLSIFVEQSGVSVVVYSAVANVKPTSTNTIIDPAHIVPDIQDVIDMMDDAEDAIDAANAAAQAAEDAAEGALSNFAEAFSSSTRYVTGQHVTYTDGKYYRFKDDHAAGAWTGADVDEVTVGAEVAELKSIFGDIEPIFAEYFDYEQHTQTTTNQMEWAAQYYDLSTGELKTLTGYSHTEKFSCAQGDIIGIGANTGQVLFWNGSTYLSYIATSPSTSMNITAPAGATLYACNNRDTNYRPTESTVTKTWTEKVLKVTEYTAPAKILYNSDAFVNKNYASTANGNLYTGDSYASYYCAYKKPCKPNHKYRTSTHTQVVYYDESGAFISGYVPYIDSANATGVKVEMEFQTPANCAYISINSNVPNEIIFDLEYTVFGSEKTAYPLLGKTVVCFGDSITGNYYFGDNYPYQIEEKTGAKVYDVGFGGCRMELTNETSIQYVNPFSMVSLADAIVSDQADKWSDQDTNANTFALKNMVKARLAILKNIDFSNVDIVTIAYGTNGIGLPLENANDPLDTYTYAGATRYAIKTLLEKYPHLRIVLLTPIYRWYSETSDDGDTHQINGQTLLDRVTKLLEVGTEIKTPTLDMYHTLGINKYNYTGYFGDSDETADGTHINSFGREQMGLRVAGELNRLF